MAITLEYDPTVVSASYGTWRIPLRVQLLGGLMLVGALLAKVWIRVETTDIGYELGRERQRMVELDRQQRALEFQLNSSLQPELLAKIGSELGLRLTAGNQLWKLESQPR